MAKIGLISDLHANIEALDAVLAVLDGEKCDRLVCLGDVVGYGASPRQCLKKVRELRIPTVKGNHDDYVADIFGVLGAHLRPEIREAIAWTQSQLDFDEAGWLGNLPMQLDFEGFSVIHSSFASNHWSYCLDEQTFAANFAKQTKQLVFCGHSHRPLVGMNVPGEPVPFVDYVREDPLPADYPVMVNIGSVGQPRDHDPRACCAVYETESRVCRLLRVEYDIAAAQQKILAAGLPKRFAERLAAGC